MTKILEQVKKDYSIIWQKFSQSRKKALWTDLRPFLSLVKPGDRVLDLGCGNARLYQVLKPKKIDYLGVDFVPEFIAECQKTYPKTKFKLLDMTKKTDWQKIKGKFDLVLCIAVFHHFPDKKTQKLVLEQIKKALVQDGILVITVWNLWKKKFWLLHLKQLGWKIIKGFKLKWLLVPFRLSDGKKEILKIDRFFYGFTKGELKNLLQNSGFKIMKQKSGNNFCLAVRSK